jgi:hypothetical protein
MRWLAILEDFGNWLAWACGPRNAMKIGVVQNSARGSGEHALLARCVRGQRRSQRSGKGSSGRARRRNACGASATRRPLVTVITLLEGSTRDLPAALGALDVALRHLATHPVVQFRKQFPSLGLELPEHTEAVAELSIIGDLQRFHLMARRDQHRPDLKGMGNPVQIGDHDRLKRRAVEVDAQPIRHFAIETRVAAISHSCNRDALKRIESLPAGAACAVLSHIPPSRRNIIR